MPHLLNKISLFPILAVAIVVANLVSKGGIIGRKTITSCFSSISVLSATDTIRLDALTCQQVLGKIGRYRYVKAVSREVPGVVMPTGTRRFFCATIMEVTDSLAPVISIGSNSARYVLQEVFCTD